VPGALAVSGWDLARGGPKPNRFAAQAGSTYFLDQPLDPWPGTLSDRPRDQQQGWGCYLKGVWTACS
jgi:CRISPR-associated protein Cmr3